MIIYKVPIQQVLDAFIRVCMRRIPHHLGMKSITLANPVKQDKTERGHIITLIKN